MNGFSKYPTENIGEKFDLTTDLRLDSFDVINVIVAFEEEFNIEIPDRHIIDLTIIGKFTADGGKEKWIID